MVDNSRGIRKSNFPAKAVPTGGYFDYTLSGVNYKIALNDMIAAFGTTGSVEQAGDPTDTAILHDQGSIKGIRNIASGQGIVASIDGANSVEIKSGIIQDGTGVSLFDNTSLNTPTIASLFAGSGIEINKVGDVITLSTTALSNTVLVNSMSDFPTAVAGVITLEDDTEYFIAGSLSTANRFVLGDNTFVHGADSSVASLTYTGTGTMFTSVNGSNKISQLTLTCATGKIFDVSASTSGFVFQLIDSTITACATVGTINAMTAVQITDVSFENIISGGTNFIGANSIFLSTRCLWTIAAGTLWGLGTATFSSGFSVVDSFVTINGSSKMLDGQTGSANIGTGALGSVVNIRISGAGTPLTNINTDDARWQFLANDDIADTDPDVLQYMSSATTVTLSAATPAVIGGSNWVTSAASQFTATTGGRCTYNGGKDARLPVDATLAVEPVTGTNKTVNAYFAVNGTVITASKQQIRVDSGSPLQLVVSWQYTFSTSDYIEVWIESVDGTNVQVNNAVFRVN